MNIRFHKMRGITLFVEEILTSQEGLLHGHVLSIYLFTSILFIWFFLTALHVHKWPFSETLSKNFHLWRDTRHCLLSDTWNPSSSPDARTHDSLFSNPSPLNKFSPHLLICKFRGSHRRVLWFLSQWCLHKPRVLLFKLLNSSQTVFLCVSDDSDNARCQWLPRIDEQPDCCVKQKLKFYIKYEWTSGPKVLSRLINKCVWYETLN